MRLNIDAVNSVHQRNTEMHGDDWHAKPAFLLAAERFRNRFVRGRDWVAPKDFSFWAVVTGTIALLPVGSTVAADSPWYPVRVAGFMCVCACLHLGMKRLRRVRATRTLRRLGRAGEGLNALDTEKRAWFKAEMGILPTDYLGCAQRLVLLRDIAATYSCTGVTAYPMFARTGQVQRSTASWVITLLVSVLLFGMQSEGAKLMVAELLFGNFEALIVIVIILSAYVLLALRGIPMVLSSFREVLGQLGCVQRGWPLDHLIRELLRLGELGTTTPVPRSRGVDGWHSL